MMKRRGGIGSKRHNANLIFHLAGAHGKHIPRKEHVNNYV